MVGKSHFELEREAAEKIGKEYVDLRLLHEKEPEETIEIHYDTKAIY